MFYLLSLILKMSTLLQNRLVFDNTTGYCGIPVEGAQPTVYENVPSLGFFGFPLYIGLFSLYV